MKDLLRPSRLARFGDFEVDLEAGELRKGGLRIRLQQQPFQILTLLLERQGHVVTREELQKLLWPNDTIVEFEHSINAAINRLREALSDSADEPRYVETLPRRGYRFIAPVVGAGPALPKRAPQAAPRHRRWRAALAGGALMVVLAVLLALNVAGLRDGLLRAVGASVSRRTAPLPKIESIAVLPLENLSGDPGQEYFADGMTEALITDLGQIGALRVISRTSVMRYKQTKKPLPEIARELNVDAIVEGTVLRSGDRVRITANLLHAPTDRHLWAQTYERDLRDVLTLQDEVARAIASEIQIKVTPNEQVRLAGARAVNPEAYRLYLIGRFLWNKRTEEGFKQAINNFQRASEIDPNYPPAYAGLADAYNLLGDWGYLPPRDAYPKAKAAAQKALQIDDTSAEAHTSLALAYFEYDWDWPACEKEYKRAIELNQNYATAHQWYSEYLSAMRRHAEAIVEAQRAQQLDPLSPIISNTVAYRYLFARQYDEAIRRSRDTVSLFPESAIGYAGLDNAYEANGMYQEAIVAYQKARSLSGSSAAEVAALGQAYAKSGIQGLLLWELRRLREESKHRYVNPAAFVYPLPGLGKKDQAFSYLEKAYEDRDWQLTMLQVGPGFDALRSDSRFQDLVRRMNFPP